MADKKETWQAFVDIWEFYKEFWEVSQADEYWERVIHEADRLYKANPTKLRRALINVVLDDMERRSKENE